jgi:adenosine deaminase
MASLAEALEHLPKVELHCHIEGTMRPATVMELARAHGVLLPTDDVTQLYRYGSLDEFLTIFWLVQSVLQSPCDWARLAYESVTDAAAHGRVYAESFFTPARHLAAGQRLSDIIAGLDEGLSAAEAETDSRCMLIADIDKAFGPRPAVEMVDELVELRRAGAQGADRVLGVGMDSTELGVDPVIFHEAFAAAGRGGLRRTGHQGEVTGPESIAACVDVLGVERVDHGLSIIDDQALVQRFVSERIPLTVCPNSNIRIANAFSRLEDHPYATMRAAGMLATLNTDDPALTDLDLGYEYRSVAEAFGWGFDDMVSVSLDGVEATWLSDDDKRVLRNQVKAAAAELRPQL